jgi:7-cyano-7-deazaguanine synthase in queuosine biosynthesis
MSSDGETQRRGIDTKSVPPRSTLVLCSGGLDSTHALWQALRAGCGPVLVHHVVLTFAKAGGPPGPRAVAEREAFEAVVACLRREYPQLRCSRSTVALPEEAEPAGRAAVLVFVAARAAVAARLCSRDVIVLGTNGDPRSGWQAGSAALALRRLLVSRGLRAGMERDDVPRLVVPEAPPTKAQMWAALPAVLRQHVMSCHSPVPRRHAAAGEPRMTGCGHCARCRGRAAVTAAKGGSGLGLAVPSPQYVNRAGAAVVGWGGAEREHLIAQSQPAVHLGLQDRTRAGGAESLAVHDAQYPQPVGLALGEEV